MALPESHHKCASSLASSYATFMSLDVNVKKGRLLGDTCLLSRTIDDIEVAKPNQHVIQSIKVVVEEHYYYAM